MGYDGRILVTGATGRIGGQVVTQLAGSGVAVRALTRDPGSDRALAGTGDEVEVVAGDLAEPDSVEPALKGVDAVFLVFPSVAADAAAPALVDAFGARRIVYLSAYGVPDDPHTGPTDPDGSIVGSHAYVERLIAGSGAPWTFLRSSGFASNTLAWADQIRAGDVVCWFHGAATRALIHERDLAAVAVRALLDDGHHGAAYHLTGPEQLTQVQQVHAIGEAIGRPLRFVELAPSAAREELLGGLPRGMVDGIIEGHRAMVDTPEPVTGAVAELIGRPALPFAQWARDHAVDFRQ